MNTMPDTWQHSLLQLSVLYVLFPPFWSQVTSQVAREPHAPGGTGGKAEAHTALLLLTTAATGHSAVGGNTV